MRKPIILAALAAVITSPAYAVTLKPGSPACLTEELFMQLARAVVSKDTDAINYLSENGCLVSGKTTKVTVLGFNDNGTVAHIRAYRGKITSEMWTITEGLEGYDPLKD